MLIICIIHLIPETAHSLMRRDISLSVLFVSVAVHIFVGPHFFPFLISFCFLFPSPLSASA